MCYEPEGLRAKGAPSAMSYELRAKNRKQHLLIISLLSILFFSLSSCTTHLFKHDDSIDDEVSQLIKYAPSAQLYPDADIIVLLDEMVEEISEDGRCETSVHKVFKIITERGKGYADCSIGFNSRTQTLSLLNAQTIAPKGKVIPLKKNAIKTVTPYSRYPAYSDYKRLTFSMPGVRVGSVIDYKYIIEEKEPTIEGEFSSANFFQWYNPIVISRYTIITPENMKVHYFMMNPLKDTQQFPSIEHQQGRKIYFWEYRNIGQILDESHMPPMEEIACNVLVTSIDSWQRFFQWWRSKIEGKTEPNELIKNKVAELTKGHVTKREKIEALFDYVKREIRYVSIGLGKTGYEPESASVVFENKYGDCKDKSTLLISMLREAGIPAHYVLIPTHGERDLIKDFPYPFQFNHCIVATEMEHGYHFLDPTAEDYRFDYLLGSDQDRDVLIFKDHETIFATTPLAKPDENGHISQQHIEIRADESIEVVDKSFPSGSKEASLRSFFIYNSPTEIKEVLEKVVDGISPGAKLLDYTHSDPLCFKKRFVTQMKYAAPDYCKKAGDILIFQVPGIKKGCSGTGKKERRYPLIFWTNASSKSEVVFTIPAGYEVYYLPEPVEITTPYFEFRSRYQSDGENVVYRGEYIKKAARIPPEEYSRYQQLCQEMEKSCEEYILFQEKK
jgi:hypothetical protein